MIPCLRRAVRAAMVTSALLSLFSLVACSGGSSNDGETGDQDNVLAELTREDSPTTCPLVKVAIDSKIPFDTEINDQASINCFAWQEFVALNWPAAASGGGHAAPVEVSDFGKPGDLDPVVWETFMNSHQLMNEDGSPPPPWGTEQPLPPACRELDSSGAGGLRVLSNTSKFSSDFDAPSDLLEAAPNDAPNWLADRNGNPVFFEIKISEEEYNYVAADNRRLYNATDQVAYLQSGQHIDLPRGTLGANLGSIELKSAWLQVKDPQLQKWRRFKLSRAFAWDGADYCQEITVALVGLHIIHKTSSNPQWLWATFEHVDNAPSQAEVEANRVDDRFTFFDPNCTPQPIDAACLDQATEGCFPIAANAWTEAGLPAPTHTSCQANQAPSYCLDLGNTSCPPYPVQVSRVVPISNDGDNLVADLNAEMRQIIRTKAGEDSVWQHYQMIGTLWSGAPVDDNAQSAAPPLAPLAQAGLRPVIEATPLFNTTMETYVQRGAWTGTDCNQGNSGECTALAQTTQTLSCQNCHAFAQIALAGKAMPDGHSVPPFATDYSFVFKKARSSANQTQGDTP